uniref:Uncharacterized protein n=1 Tax=Zea mays TaxID=4577 RepID=C0PAA7_MAIZE|nr:unknown [Zea mays]|eukprot:NP_001168935.1 uncharacterized protein LOC100382748 [Zea mays]
MEQQVTGAPVFPCDFHGREFPLVAISPVRPLQASSDFHLPATSKAEPLLPLFGALAAGRAEPHGTLISSSLPWRPRKIPQPSPQAGAQKFQQPLHGRAPYSLCSSRPSPVAHAELPFDPVQRRQQQLLWMTPRIFFSFQRLPVHLPPSRLSSPAAARPFLLFPGAAARSPCSECSRGVQVSAQRCRSKTAAPMAPRAAGLLFCVAQ